MDPYAERRGYTDQGYSYPDPLYQAGPEADVPDQQPWYAKSQQIQSTPEGYQFQSLNDDELDDGYLDEDVEISDEILEDDDDYYIPVPPPATPAPAQSLGGASNIIILPQGIYPAQSTFSPAYCQLHPFECQGQNPTDTIDTIEGQNITEKSASPWRTASLGNVDFSGIGVALLIVVLVFLGLNLGWNKEDKDAKAASGTASGKDKKDAKSGDSKEKDKADNGKPPESKKNDKKRPDKEEKGTAGDTGTTRSRSDQPGRGTSTGDRGKETSAGKDGATPIKDLSKDWWEPPPPQSGETKDVKDARKNLQRAQDEERKAMQAAEKDLKEKKKDATKDVILRDPHVRVADKKRKEAEGKLQKELARSPPSGDPSTQTPRSTGKDRPSKSENGEKNVERASSKTDPSRSSSRDRPSKSERGEQRDVDRSSSKTAASGETEVDKAKRRLSDAKKAEKKVVDAFKQKYKAKHGKSPSQRDIETDPSVAAAKSKTLEKENELRKLQGLAAIPPIIAPSSSTGAKPSSSETEEDRAKRKLRDAQKAEKDANDKFKADYKAVNGKSPSQKETVNDPSVAAAEKERQKRANDLRKAQGKDPLPTSERSSNASSSRGAPSGSGGTSSADDKKEKDIKRAEKEVREAQAKLGDARNRAKSKLGSKATKDAIAADPDVKSAQRRVDRAQAKVDGLKGIPPTTTVVQPVRSVPSVTTTRPTPAAAPAPLDSRTGAAVATTGDDPIAKAEADVARAKKKLREAQSDVKKELGSGARSADIAKDSKVRAAQREYDKALEKLNKLKGGSTATTVAPTVLPTVPVIPAGNDPVKRAEKDLSDANTKLSKAKKDASQKSGANEKSIQDDPKVRSARRQRDDAEKRLDEAKAETPAGKEAAKAEAKGKAKQAEHAAKTANDAASQAGDDLAKVRKMVKKDLQTKTGKVPSAEEVENDPRVQAAKKKRDDSRAQAAVANQADKNAKEAVKGVTPSTTPQRAARQKSQTALEKADQELRDAREKAIDKLRKKLKREPTEEEILADPKVKKATQARKNAKDAYDAAKKAEAGADAAERVKSTSTPRTRLTEDSTSTGISPAYMLLALLLLPLLGLLFRGHSIIPLASTTGNVPVAVAPPGGRMTMSSPRVRSPASGKGSNPQININNVNAQDSIVEDTGSGAGNIHVEESGPVYEEAMPIMGPGVAHSAWERMSWTGPHDSDRFLGMAIAGLMVAAPILFDMWRDWPRRSRERTEYLDPFYHWIIAAIVKIFACYSLDRHLGISAQYGGRVGRYIDRVPDMLSATMARTSEKITRSTAKVVERTMESTEGVVGGMEDMVLGDGQQILGIMLVALGVAALSRVSPSQDAVKVDYAPVVIQGMYIIGAATVGVLVIQA